MYSKTFLQLDDKSAFEERDNMRKDLVPFWEKAYQEYDTIAFSIEPNAKRTDTATAKVVDAISSGDIIPLYNASISHVSIVSNT